MIFHAQYPKSKYNAKKTVVDGITFDSKKEAERYTELKLMEQVGKITHLQRQVPFTLIPAQKDPNTGKAIRACKYRADFVYYENGLMIVEDVKGVQTPEYKIKKKLMLEKYGILITEI